MLKEPLTRDRRHVAILVSRVLLLEAPVSLVASRSRSSTVQPFVSPLAVLVCLVLPVEARVPSEPSRFISVAITVTSSSCHQYRHLDPKCRQYHHAPLAPPRPRSTATTQRPHMTATPTAPIGPPHPAPPLHRLPHCHSPT